MTARTFVFSDGQCVTVSGTINRFPIGTACSVKRQPNGLYTITSLDENKLSSFDIPGRCLAARK